MGGGGQDRAGATWLDMMLNVESPDNRTAKGNSDTNQNAYMRDTAIGGLIISRNEQFILLIMSGYL